MCLKDDILCCYYSGCEGEADIIFLLDASDLVTREDFDYSIDFVRVTVSKLDISKSNTQVGVALIADYTGVPAIYLDEYSDKTRLLDAIDRVNYVGTPGNLSSSLQNVRSNMFIDVNGARNNMPRVLVFITSDARDFTSEALLTEAQRLKDEQIELLGVVYGRSRDRGDVQEELDQIVARPTRNYQFTVTDARSLDVIKDSFKRQLCSDVPGL